MNDDLQQPLSVNLDDKPTDNVNDSTSTTGDKERRRSSSAAEKFDSAFEASETTKKLVESDARPFWQDILMFYKGLIIGFILFFIFLFVRINPGSAQSAAQSKTIGVALFMVSLWVTEQVPISITALLPIALFPLCGILDTARVTAQYSNNITFLLGGSFMIALAMERWNLHKRIVYHLLLRFGVGPKRILGGFMISTCILSMWMSNATAALIMLPIAHSIAENAQGDNSIGISPKRLERAYLLAIAFAANIGGTLTPIGTPPNLVTISVMRKTFPGSPEISFLVWMSFAVPLGILLLAVGFVYLSWRFFGLFGAAKPEHYSNNLTVSNDDYALLTNANANNNTPDTSSASQQPQKAEQESQKKAKIHIDTTKIFRDKLDALGPMKFAEKVVAVAFIILIILWIFRADIDVAPGSDCSRWRGCMPGWHHIFSDGLTNSSNPGLTSSEQSRFVEDSVSVMLIVIPLFLIPARDGSGSMILDWDSVAKLPWNILWLVGGGFALAAAFQDTGLAAWFASSLEGLASAPPFAVLIVVIIMVVFLTTISSNFAVSSAIVPVLGSFAAGNGINPLFLCVPCTIAVSFAFLLPTSTTSNAVIFGTGKMPMKTMFKHGILMSASGILLILACWAAFGQFAYRANVFEAWALPKNNTNV